MPSTSAFFFYSYWNNVIFFPLTCFSYVSNETNIRYIKPHSNYGNEAFSFLNLNKLQFWGQLLGSQQHQAESFCLFLAPHSCTVPINLWFPMLHLQHWNTVIHNPQSCWTHIDTLSSVLRSLHWLHPGDVPSAGVVKCGVI